MPSSVVPLKNSTLLIDPPLSLAVAARAIVAGAVKLAPEAGLVSATEIPLPPPPPPLQVVPLRVKAVGAVLVPV